MKILFKKASCSSLNVFFSHFRECNVPDLMFCHRWLLVCFKREFKYEEAIRHFEIVQSQHLKFDSHAALSTQDDQFRQEVGLCVCCYFQPRRK